MNNEGVEVQKLLALMVLFCGAASADAAETLRWCSDDAQLLFQKDDSWILRVDGKPDEQLAGSRDIILADLILYDEKTEQRQNDVVYARGRIFQPCRLTPSGPQRGSEREAELEAALEKARAETSNLADAIEKNRAETSKLTDAIEKNRAETSKLEAAIEKIRSAASKSGQTLSKLRRAIAQILQDLKRE